MNIDVKILNKILANNKEHIWQTHSKPYSQWWKTESISSNIRNKIKVPTLTNIIQYSFGSPSIET